MKLTLILICATALSAGGAANAAMLSADDVTGGAKFSDCLFCDQFNVIERGYNGLGTFSAFGSTATVIRDPYAGVMASAASGLDHEIKGASSVLDYYMVAGGPTGPGLRLLISFNLGAQSQGPDGTISSASIEVDGINDRVQEVRLLQCPNCGSEGMHTELSIPATAGFVYKIELTAAAGTVGSGSASAFADPLITIDPSTPNASLYSIELSPGVVNALGPAADAATTPEPASFALFGLGMAGGMLYRRLRSM
jgi:hypothetical protein